MGEGSFFSFVQKLGIEEMKIETDNKFFVCKLVTIILEKGAVGDEGVPGGYCDRKGWDANIQKIP